jgi:hypothetical protein
MQISKLAEFIGQLTLIKKNNPLRHHMSSLLIFGILLSVGLSVMSRNALAVPISGLGATLVKVSDGTSPFPTIDPNGTNGMVATLDEARYRFDVNLNTLNGSTHSLTNITITATLVSPSPDVRWIRESLPNFCNTKTVSVDGKTLTCKINGPINTGSTLNIDAAWFGKSNAPNGTTVDTNFSVSATQASVNALDQPVPAVSSTDRLTVVSEPGTYEVRKVTPSTDPQNSNGRTIIRDVNGAPTSVRYRWGIQVETKSTAGATNKGVSTIGFGDLNLVDNLSSAPSNQLPITTKGTLVGCYPNISGSPSGTNQMSLSTHSTNFYNASVQNSGNWSCSQPGGTGSDIAISASDIIWSPDWYPGVSAGNSFANEQWGFNVTGVTNDAYNTPAGQNNRAVVATQIIEIEYPYADIVAFNQTPGDQNTLSNAVGFCNQIESIAVDGATNYDEVTNNSSCNALSFATSVSSGNGKFFIGKNQTASTRGPEEEFGFSEGSLSQGQFDNYIAPGQEFGVSLITGNQNTSIEGISNAVVCDAFESDKYNIISHYAPPDGGNPSGVHSWYSWQQAGTAVSGFPDVLDSDIVVEFSSANNGASWGSYSAQRTYNCDTAGLTWVTDPSSHPAGLGNVNLVRVRFLKSIPPGVTISTYLSVKAKNTLNANDRIANFMKYKSTQTTSGSWSVAGAACDPVAPAFNSLTGTYGCQRRADRAFVIAPPLYIVKSDTPAANVDAIASASPGSSWTYTLRSGLNWNANANINGVHVYDVLPAGMLFESSSLGPSLLILDCDANINPSCLDNPAARTNYGQTTIVWDRGDYNFIDTDSDTSTITTDPAFFGEWTVTVKLNSTLPNNITLQNKSWIKADSGAQMVNLPLPFRTGSSPKLDLPASGSFDDDWIKITTAVAFNIDKTVVEDRAPFGDRIAEIGLNGVAKYDLSYGNMSGSTNRTMDAIDVLPYNGDGRTPHDSLIEGSYTVTKLQPVVNSSNINSIYITSDAPATISSDPQNAGNTPVGSLGRWKCTFAQRGSAGCLSSNSITAIRIISNPLSVGQWGTIRLELTTSGNNGNEWYSNSYSARATGLTLPTTSSGVTVTTPCLRLGDRFFLDADRDGAYSSGDNGIDGVDLELISVGADNAIGGGDDLVVKSATTNGGGYYNFDCFVPGKYYVRVASYELSTGGSLEGLLPGRLSSVDPTNGIDESLDHNLINSGGTYRTNIVDIDFGTAPLGEPGVGLPLNTADQDSNLTLDLAVERPFDVQLDKYVDGNNDSIFSKLEQIPVPSLSGHPDPTTFKYKFIVSVPAWADASTGVVMTDIIRPGVRVSSIESVSQGSLNTALPVMGSPVAGSPLVWDVGDLNPGSSATLVVSADLASVHLGDFATGFQDGVSRNITQITAMDQTDVDSSPDNIAVYNPMSHEDDESDASITIPPILGDRVWLDYNNNGVQDSGESGLSNVIIKLYKDDDGIPGQSSGDTLVGSQPTNIDGYWMFGGLDINVQYYAALDPDTLPIGYIATLQLQGPDTLVDSNVSSNFISDMHSLVDGEINLGVDFGLHPRLSLGDSVFVDANNNGKRDIGDPREVGISGVAVQLFSSSDTSFSSVLASTTTDSQGDYRFLNLDAGDYVVRIPDIRGDTSQQYISTNTSGYEPAPDPNDDINSDDNGTESSPTVVSKPISLGYNAEPTNDGDADAYTNLSLDFGFVQFFSVGNRIFIDSNGNGIRDPAEVGISEPVTLRLLNPDQSPYDTDPLAPGVQELLTTTDSQGYYYFDNILAGDYVVEAQLPDGYHSTLDGIDTSSPNSPTNDTDRGVGNGTGTIISGVFALGPNGNEPTGDEDSQTASTNPLLLDQNRNMTIDFGVVPPFDLTITKSIDSSSQTYATGLVEYNLMIENIGAGPAMGDINVVDRLPVGLLYDSVESPASNWSCADDSGDVRCVRSPGSGSLPGGGNDKLTIVTRINSGQNSPDPYANMAKVVPSSLEYNDEVVPVGSMNDGFESGDPSTDSNNDASASFSIKRYSVGDKLFIDINGNGTEDATDWPLAGVTITAISPGPDGDYDTADDNITYNTISDSDGLYSFNDLPYSQWRTSISNLPPGIINVYDFDGDHDNANTAMFNDPNIIEDFDQDFGYKGTASVGDYIWWDTNANGLQDAGEPSAEGVTVELTWAGPDDDISTSADNKTLSTITDSSGDYLFDNLVAGTYLVHVVPRTATANLTTSNQDHQVNLTDNQAWRDSDFGFDDQGTIGNLVFFDRNNNGVKDLDEPGIPGVVLELYLDANGDGVINSEDKMIAERTTDDNGMYLFGNLLTDDGIPANDNGVTNSASYIIKVSRIDSSSPYSKYWDKLRQVLGAVGTDNNGQNALGYMVTLSASVSSVTSGDFAYFDEGVSRELYPEKTSTDTSASLSKTGQNIFGILMLSTIIIILPMANKSVDRSHKSKK